MKNRKQYNNTSSLNEPVSLPFPLGKNNNTTHIKNAKLGKLPEKASSVLIESNIPLPLGCQRKIPEIPYDFFGCQRTVWYPSRRLKKITCPCEGCFPVGPRKARNKFTKQHPYFPEAHFCHHGPGF